MGRRKGEKASACGLRNPTPESPTIRIQCLSSGSTIFGLRSQRTISFLEVEKPGVEAVHPFDN